MAGCGVHLICHALQRDVTKIDTCDLLKLRRVMLDDEADEYLYLGCVMRENLMPFRTEYLAIGHAKFGDIAGEKLLNERGIHIFRQVWDLFSRLDQVHPLYIPPIYLNPMLDHLVAQLVAAARLREVHHDVQEAHSTGHFVISGLEGTGKTTLLKAFAIAVAALGQRFFLMYVDYQMLVSNMTPRHLAAELYIRVAFNCFEGTFGLNYGKDAAAMQPGLDGIARMDVDEIVAAMVERTWLSACIGIAGDEIQQKLLADASDDSIYVDLLRKLHSFARFTVGALLILSGSTADLRSRLFESCRRPEYKAYDNFNGSLCGFYHVCALRTVGELERYILRRYPMEACGTIDRIPQILHETGGIGRLVHAFITKEALSAPGKYNPTVDFSCLSSGLAVVASLIRRHQARHDSDKRLEKFIAEVAAGRTAFLEPTAVSIPYGEAEICLSDYTGGNAKDLLEDLVDKGFLYMTSTNPRTYTDVQLSRPIDAATYYVN